MWKKIGNFILLKTGCRRRLLGAFNGLSLMGIMALCLIIFPALVLASEEKISMSVSQKEILLGDSVILTITVEGMSHPETPELPEISNFDVKFRGMRQKSFSSVTVIVNGRRIKDEKSGGGHSFDFELIPKNTGMFTIPAFPILINGKEFVTQSFQVKVFSQSEKREDIFIDVHTDKADAYLGEKVLVTFKWYFNKDIGNYRINIPWLEGARNFLVADPEHNQNRTYQRLIINGDKQIAALKSREFYKGREYMVVSFQKVLTPMAAGRFTLDSVFLKCDVVTGYRRSRHKGVMDSFFGSKFDDFFGFGKDAITEPFATRSNEIILNIDEVPEQDKPKGYNGAVGKFTFDVKVKPVSLKVGEPITLTMKVAGSGNIEQLALPHVPDIESFKSYEPESKVNVFHAGEEIRGEKIFEKILIPRYAGDYQIPEITFAFFNPGTGRYQMEKRGPFKIHVAQAEKENEIRVIAITSEGGEGTQKRELKVLQKGIHYIMTDIGKVIPSRKPVYESISIWIIFFLSPILMLMGMFFFGKRCQKLNTDVAFARSRTALKNSRKFFKLTESALKKGRARDFYDSLVKGLNIYLAEKLNRQLGSVGIETVCELKGKGLKEKECFELKALYHTANEVIFSSLSTGLEKLKRDFKKASELIIHMERIL